MKKLLIRDVYFMLVKGLFKYMIMLGVIHSLVWVMVILIFIVILGNLCLI